MASSFWEILSTNFNTTPSTYIGVEAPVSTSILPDDVETVIVGGGLLGLSTALELAQAGSSVAVIEAKNIGDGPSGRSGGELWPGFGGSLGEMINRLDKRIAISAWQLTHEALVSVHQRASAREDKCDFMPGVLLTSKTFDQSEWINRESQIILQSGFQFSTLLSSTDIKNNYVNTNRYHNGILYMGADTHQYGHLNPLKYTQTVAKLAQQFGAKIIDKCLVTNVSSLKTEGFQVKTQHGTVKTRNVVLATGANFSRPSGIGFEIVPRIYIPVQTVILATEVISEELAREMVPGDACFCDASTSSMNYGRLIPEPSRDGYYRLTLGGADALTQFMAALEIIKIEREMRRMFPQLDRENIKIEAIWAGNCDRSRSELPVLINSHKGLYYAAGFSGQGMVNTALYGSAIAERILAINTSKFETLALLNSVPYANNTLLAWIQAAMALSSSL